MFGGMDPKKMQAVMKQMGIKQEEIEALKVIIEKTDGSKVIIEEPSIIKIIMQGQESWQISGNAREESAEEGISEEDIQIVMDKTNKSYDVCKNSLNEHEGDLARCILALSE